MCHLNLVRFPRSEPAGLETPVLRLPTPAGQSQPVPHAQPTLGLTGEFLEKLLLELERRLSTLDYLLFFT